MSNINGYCPKCGFDFDGDLVVETFLNQGKSQEEAEETASHCAGFSKHGLLNRWSRKIGIYDLHKDRTTNYQCPERKETF